MLSPRITQASKKLSHFVNLPKDIPMIDPKIIAIKKAIKALERVIKQSEINVPSNIQGGALGVWAGFAPVYDTLICKP